MKEEYYDLNRMVDLAIDKYDLPNDRESRKKWREKIQWALKKTDIPGQDITFWKKASAYPDDKKTRYRLPKEDAIYVVYNVCADYFEERSGDKYKRAQLLNNAFYEGLYTMDEEEQERVANTNYPDMEKSVKEVMLEAIFNKYKRNRG